MAFSVVRLFLFLLLIGGGALARETNLLDGASFVSKQWFGSGFFHMKIKLPRGNSADVVTTFYLTSGDGDEVKDKAHDELDFEFLGNIKGEPILLQTNVFANGTSGREQRITLWFDPTTEYHDYKILWNQNQIVFYVDDIPIRVFKKLTESGVPFPSQPLQIQASLWHAKWASQNETDWRYAPFKAHYQGFDISGCPCATKQCMNECYGQNYWWNDIRELNSDQRRAYEDRRFHGGLSDSAPHCPNLIALSQRPYSDSSSFLHLMALPLLLLLRRVLLPSLSLTFCPNSPFQSCLGNGHRRRFLGGVASEAISGSQGAVPLQLSKQGPTYQLQWPAPPSLPQSHISAGRFRSFTLRKWNFLSHKVGGGFDPISSNKAKPPGVELWAVFDAPLEQVDESGKNVIHALSGLFCASINFLESSTSYLAPEWGYRPTPGSLRYGTLPREAVCSENLTPWLKLLPCRDKAGISALMDRPSIYKGFYHSQRLRLTSSEFELEGIDYLQKENEISSADKSAYEGVLSNPGFELSVKPNRSRPFDLDLTWKLPVVWSCQKAPLHASRFLMGSRNERGAVVISLRSTEVSDELLHTDMMFVNEQPQEVSDIIEKMHVSPSVNKMSPGVMEMVLKFPRGMKSATITLEFDKGYSYVGIPVVLNCEISSCRTMID
ncbi:unnamed protein product [Prunus armeniaca]|uniref:GH16 domain-containing protein n=1 Tax=Prunus armeniaca TaxID=36596 RepID=A0A6J5YAY1_PRUAR|nr:unnamed protein product [Prunus armeniaca]